MKQKYKKLLFLISDVLLISLSVWLAFLLRFDGKIPIQYLEKGTFQGLIILALVFTLPVFYFFKLYSFSWIYVSTQELISLFKATILSFLFSGAAILIFRDFAWFSGFPRSTLFISYFLIFLFCGEIRFSKRIYLQMFQKGVKKEKARTLIIGAGDAGEQILRGILGSKYSPYLPVGFIDDELAKQGLRIHGLKVLGKIKDIPQIVESQGMEQIIIALPSAGSKTIKQAVEQGRKAGLKKIKIIPPITELINGEVSLGNIRDVGVEDLLGREPVLLDTRAIKSFVQDKIVLITGAAGSIGSELSRQVAKFKPSQLLLLDQDETGIFNIIEELRKKFSKLEISSEICDIQDKEKIERIFNKFKPNIIFHAAAYKHVPLMEEHSDEAVKNNIFGTKIVADVSLKYNVEKFVFISTDKAVNPTSVMGATKRVGEMVCQALNQKPLLKFGNKERTKFISVRFGNVLDSRGSVIPIFREQIKKGGPVEVTHPEMKRYFMTTSEACLLVMQSGAMGKGGEVFVLDMGKPVKILSLAKEMINLSGFEPDRDIPIVFTEPRPGEKFFEEILTAEEGTIATESQKIFMAKLSKVNKRKIERSLKDLKNVAKKFDQKEIIKILKELIPFYSPHLH